VPVGAAEALVELAPNVLLTEASSTGAHLGALATLVEQVPCYRLATGHDLDEVGHMLAEKVSEATAAEPTTALAGPRRPGRGGA
jgi:hypothetical protein